VTWYCSMPCIRAVLELLTTIGWASKLSRCKLGHLFCAGQKTQSKSKQSFHPSYACLFSQSNWTTGPTKFSTPAQKSWPSLHRTSLHQPSLPTTTVSHWDFGGVND